MVSSAVPISDTMKKIWDKWNLRGFIMLSLLLQVFLIFCAPLRKRTSSKWVIVPIWLAYLLADWAANFAIGLIASSQTGTNGRRDNGGLLAFWAPFLLIHLGGPDTIIAISMEDNALWPRHFLGLIFQVLAVGYVFIMQSTRENKLWWPTLLLIFPGLVKYGERTRALYLASLSSLKDSILAVPDTGPDYAKYMDEYSSRKDANLPIRIHTDKGRGSAESKIETLPEEEGIKNIAVVQKAYQFFPISMGLIIDLLFDFHQRNESRAYFLNRNPVEAYTLIATELNFMYEALYTKAHVVHYLWGYVLRATSFGTVWIALGFFYKLDKHGFHRFDVRVTYSLLLGAIALDSIAISMLILSDWTVVKCGQKSCSLATSLMNKHLNLKRARWRTTEKTTKWKILFGRWSESVSTFSFINYSLKECRRGPPTVMDYVGLLGTKIIKHSWLNNIWVEIKYILRYRNREKLSRELWEFIFEELKSKSEDAVDPQNGSKICSARGEWILKEYYYGDGGPLFNNLRSRVYLSDDVTYDRIILLWHIATELRYHDEKPQNSNAGDHKNSNAGDDGAYREFSKTLSDYMLYLLVMQSDLMSAVAGIGQKRFSDTFAEAKQFFEKRALEPDASQQDACGKLLEVNTEIKPVDVKGNRSKSVLFDACILAKELKNMKWKLISEVWVELLSYAASHCRPSSHAQLLSKGGELVTFVWLLMAHFGIAEQFQVQEDQARVKLIVEKPGPADEVFYWSGEKPPESKATGSIQ